MNYDDIIIVYIYFNIQLRQQSTSSNTKKNYSIKRICVFLKVD